MNWIIIFISIAHLLLVSLKINTVNMDKLNFEIEPDQLIEEELEENFEDRSFTPEFVFLITLACCLVFFLGLIVVACVVFKKKTSFKTEEINHV